MYMKMCLIELSQLSIFVHLYILINIFNSYVIHFNIEPTKLQFVLLV